MLSVSQSQTISQAPPALIIRAIESRGNWTLEFVQTGGVKRIVATTEPQALALASNLTANGWRVNASIYNAGWAARPTEPIPFNGEPLPRAAELEADLEHARNDLRHAATETGRRAARRAIELLEAELDGVQ